MTSKYTVKGVRKNVWIPYLPSKWKKWLGGLRFVVWLSTWFSPARRLCSRRLAASRPAGLWILRTILQVGHEVSCSNQDCKHELQEQLLTLINLHITHRKLKSTHHFWYKLLLRKASETTWEKSAEEHMWTWEWWGNKGKEEITK